MQLRLAQDRGRFQNAWLHSAHSFSFGDYYDPNFMGVSYLRVINDDRVAPGQGFATHPHNNMEIVSVALQGALEHKDSMGNGSIIRPGDVQRMSAGTGVMHSEFNPSPTEPVHFLQIWLEPTKQDIPPSYAQRFFSQEDKQGQLRLILSPTGEDDSLSVHTDAYVYASILSHEDVVTHTLASERVAYVHVATGNVCVNGQRLSAGDAVTIEEGEIVLQAPAGENQIADHNQVLLFDLGRKAE